MSKLYVDELHPKTSGGAVLTPVRPSIMLDMDDKSTASGYDQVNQLAAIPFRNKISGVGISINTSTFGITIPTSGFYQIDLSILNDAVEGIELAITVNGTANGDIILRNFTHETRSCTIHAAWEFSANDVVYAVNNSGAARGIYRQLATTPDTGRYSFWSTYLIG